MRQTPTQLRHELARSLFRLSLLGLAGALLIPPVASAEDPLAAEEAAAISRLFAMQREIDRKADGFENSLQSLRTLDARFPQPEDYGYTGSLENYLDAVAQANRSDGDKSSTPLPESVARFHRDLLSRLDRALWFSDITRLTDQLEAETKIPSRTKPALVHEESKGNPTERPYTIRPAAIPFLLGEDLAAWDAALRDWRQKHHEALLQEGLLRSKQSFEKRDDGAAIAVPILLGARFALLARTVRFVDTRPTETAAELQQYRRSAAHRWIEFLSKPHAEQFRAAVMGRVLEPDSYRLETSPLRQRLTPLLELPEIFDECEARLSELDALVGQLTNEYSKWRLKNNEATDKPSRDQFLAEILPRVARVTGLARHVSALLEPAALIAKNSPDPRGWLTLSLPYGELVVDLNREDLNAQLSGLKEFLTSIDAANGKLALAMATLTQLQLTTAKRVRALRVPLDKVEEALSYGLSIP